jgi:hypothetical protein
MAHFYPALYTKSRAGVEIILMKKGGVYVPAWLLVPSAKIRETDFLSGPRLCAVALKS